MNLSNAEINIPILNKISLREPGGRMCMSFSLNARDERKTGGEKKTNKPESDAVVFNASLRKAQTISQTTSIHRGGIQ